MNKSLKTILLISGVGIVGYLAYRYVKTQIGVLKNYEYKIIGVKVKKISLTSVVFDIKTRFFNKSKIEAVVEKLYLAIKIEGANVGYITENKSFVIPPQGFSDVDLQIASSPQDVAKNIIGIVLGGIKRKDIKFTLEGYANIRSGFISTTLPITYSDVASEYV